MTITRQLFNRFSNHDLHPVSSHKTDWTSLTLSYALLCLSYSKVYNLVHAVEGACSLFRFLDVVVYIYYCCDVGVFLLTCLQFFYAGVRVILSSAIICKKVCLLHCFKFLAFVYNFNVNRCKTNTTVSRCI